MSIENKNEPEKEHRSKKKKTLFWVKFMKCILKVKARSIRKHLSDLEKLVFELENQPDVLFLSETGLTVKDKARNYLSPDHDELYLSIRDKTAGGVMVQFKTSCSVIGKTRTKFEGYISIKKRTMSLVW